MQECSFSAKRADSKPHTVVQCGALLRALVAEKSMRGFRKSSILLFPPVAVVGFIGGKLRVGICGLGGRNCTTCSGFSCFCVVVSETGCTFALLDDELRGGGIFS